MMTIQQQYSANVWMTLLVMVLGLCCVIVGSRRKQAVSTSGPFIAAATLTVAVSWCQVPHTFGAVTTIYHFAGQLLVLTVFMPYKIALGLVCAATTLALSRASPHYSLIDDASILLSLTGNVRARHISIQFLVV
jgi:hypothetical protein